MTQAGLSPPQQQKEVAYIGCLYFPGLRFVQVSIVVAPEDRWGHPSLHPPRVKRTVGEYIGPLESVEAYVIQILTPRNMLSAATSELEGLEGLIRKASYWPELGLNCEPKKSPSPKHSIGWFWEGKRVKMPVSVIETAVLSLQDPQSYRTLSSEDLAYIRANCLA
ncbi:hypothetical protein HYY73_00890 [Candidatus Woesearchaeota archaeon]|nr:hypothetical protein [Candidatus Woesearchaeota archaeon]